MTNKTPSSKTIQGVDRRAFPRIQTSNRVGYVLFGKEGKKIERGKGWTTNLSQTGTLLETEKPLAGTFVVLMTIDLDGRKVAVQGRIVRTQLDAATGRFKTGIRFEGPKEKQQQAIVAFVKSNAHRQKSTTTSDE